MSDDRTMTLPDRLDDAVLEDRPRADLLAEASDRIVELEEQLLKAQGDANFYKARVHKLRSAIVGHRGQRDWHGGKIQADLTLWQMVNDVPWGEPIKGDG